MTGDRLSGSAGFDFPRLFHMEFIPKLTQSAGELRAGRPARQSCHLRGEIFERRQNFLTQPFERFDPSRIVGNLNRFTPCFAVPAEFERGIFELVNLRLVHG